MIKVDVQCKSFGETPVLGKVSLTIEKGETVAILGPSGIGKSTLLRIIAGIDDDYHGTVVRPDNMAIVFQEPTLLPWRSVIQNLTLLHPDLSKSNATEMLERVGIADKSGLFPGQLSLGQQRRLALARAFAGAPDFLVMDEPFVSLDAGTATAMLELTETLIADCKPATLFVTHSQAEATRLATRIHTLSGSPATLDLITQKGT
ncbi:ABC transporter ATP-binding protein [uncultured Roseovarius sp.]|uniref:ABC transporter ATP-binding protein n=1 Tax=uncultured Roseovarius sp. TaxID=293344 RepID=UPI002630C02F|nr:ABC transporter ATP-binding protein [uncultured Roseovarius sp.]